MWDQEGAYRFAALQSQAGRALLQRSGRRPDDISSIVLVRQNAVGALALALWRGRRRCRLHCRAGRSSISIAAL